MVMTTTESPELMASLKEATAELHRYAETRPFQKSLLTGTAMPATFRRYLIELHAIHNALEQVLCDWRARRPELASVFNDDQRRAADLEADIAALSAHIALENATERNEATGARTVLLAFIDAHAHSNVFAILGCFYVLEGSMNGNKFIARALAKAWGIELNIGLSYLDPYGEQQRANWQRFREAMNRLDVTPEDVEAAVHAACLTFETIARISDEVHDRPPGI